MDSKIRDIVKKYIAVKSNSGATSYGLDTKSYVSKVYENSSNTNAVQQILIKLNEANK